MSRRYSTYDKVNKYVYFGRKSEEK